MTLHRKPTFGVTFELLSRNPQNLLSGSLLSEIESPEIPGLLGGQEVHKSGKSPESLRKVSGECFWTFFGAFWRLFRGPGEALGDIFETFSAFRAQRARETPARGGLAPNARFLCKKGMNITNLSQSPLGESSRGNTIRGNRTESL